MKRETVQCPVCGRSLRRWRAVFGESVEVVPYHHDERPGENRLVQCKGAMTPVRK